MNMATNFFKIQIIKDNNTQTNFIKKLIKQTSSTLIRRQSNYEK